MKVCSSCGEENPDRFRLCGFCGTPLPEEAEAAPQETRKTVTVVFCDLQGSTSMAERLDHESLREVLTYYFAEMRACIEHHGGAVEKYIGDAIMAVFGLPTAHEDDALRAVRAAAEMREVLSAVNDRVEARWGVRLTNRTGVNTGVVVATGDFEARHHLVAGDAVNVAARLEQAAPALEILLGEPTYRLVKDAVEVEVVEPLELKGKSERVPAYRLITVSASDGVARRVDAPIVGRDEELAALDRVLEEATDGRVARLLTVVAPAGTGKSRLLSEFVHRSAGRAVALRGRCLSYGEGITFWPLGEITRQAAAITDDDGTAGALAKLVTLVRDQGAEGPDIAVRLAGAIGLSDEVSTLEETFWAARRFLEALARRRPLIVIVDDIHWAEPTFLDLIRYVAESASDAPLLLVCTARRDLLEDHPDWAEDRPGAATLFLQPLSTNDSAQVVSNLVGGAELDPDVQARIVAAAEGNPLFVEQLLGMLMDDGVLSRTSEGRWAATGEVGELQIPPTISALLTARLDRLTAPERAVIETGSVIGAVFFQGAVKALSSDSVRPRVEAGLESLAAKELVHRTDSLFSGDAAFRFGHILIRDAAYHGVLKRTRAGLHEQFVDWLEGMASDRVWEFEEIRGHHLEQAYLILAQLGPIDEHGRQVGRRGARYLSSAGARAFARGDLPAAAGLLRRAGALLPENHPDRPRVLLQAGEALTELGELSMADAMLRSAEELASQCGAESLAVTARLGLLYLHYVTQAAGGEAAVVAEVEAAIPTLERAGDQVGLARAWRILWYVHGTACRWTAAEAAARQVMEHAELAGDQRLSAGFVSSLAFCALYGPLPVPEAIDRCRELLVRAAEDRKAEANILLLTAHLEAMRGTFDTARELYRRSRSALEELGWKVQAARTSLVSGHVELLAGDPAAAEAELRHDHAALEAMGERNYIATVAGFLAESLLAQAKVEEAEVFAGECRNLAAPDDLFTQALWRMVLAKIRAGQGAAEEAESLSRAAVALIEPSDELDSRGMALLDLAEVLAASGKVGEAIDAAAAAGAAFRAKGNVVSEARAGDVVRRLRTTAGAETLTPSG